MFTFGATQVTSPEEALGGGTMQLRRGGDAPLRSRAAVGVLVILASAAWLAIVFGEPGDQPRVTVLESFGFDDSFDDNQDVAADPHLAKLPGGAKGVKKSSKLEFERTLAAVPEMNPLGDFDADFLGGPGTSAALKGFPQTTGTSDWPFTKNPLRNFDQGFKASWTGVAELPEDNIYSSFPAHYPYLETVPAPSTTNTRGYDWANVGAVAEDNVFTAPGYHFPAY